MTKSNGRVKKARGKPRKAAARNASISAGDNSVIIDGDVKNSTINISSQSVIPVPHMAPSYPQLFVGREKALKELVGKLLSKSEQSDPLMRNIALAGMGGIGKTTLAAAVVNDPAINKHFSDGILWTELGPEPDMMSLLAEWGKQLGEDFTSYSLPESRSRALSDALYDRKLLLFVDNIWNSAHARLILVGGPKCRALLTTRNTEVARALAGSNIVHVEVLSPDASMELIRKISPDAIQTDEAGAKQLISQLEGLPLGLTIAGRLLAEEVGAGLGVSGILEELRDKQKRLEMSSESHSLAAILKTSYDCLPSELHQRVFRLLGIFTIGGKSVSFSAEAASAISGLDLRSLQKAMVILVSRALVEAAGEGRYVLHSVLADYAATLLDSSEENLARMNHSQYFLGIARQYSEPSLVDWSALNQDWDNIRSSLKWSCDNLELQNHNSAFLELTADFVSALMFIVQTRIPPESMRWLEAGEMACDRLGRVRDKAWIVLTKGQMELERGDLDTAMQYFEKGQTLFESVQEADGAIYARGNQGSVYHIKGNYAQALEIYEQITQACAGRGDINGTAVGRYNQADVYHLAGNSDEALRQLNEGIPLCRMENSWGLLVKMLSLMSKIHLEMGNLHQALNESREAHAISTQANSVHLLGLASRAMGEVLMADNQLKEGGEYFMQSLKLLTESKTPLDLAEAHEAFGDALAGNNQVHEAGIQWKNAQKLFELIGAVSKAQRISSLLQQAAPD